MKLKENNPYVLITRSYVAIMLDTIPDNNKKYYASVWKYGNLDHYVEFTKKPTNYRLKKILKMEIILDAFDEAEKERNNGNN